MPSDDAYRLIPDKNDPSYPFYLLYFEGGGKWPPTQVYEHVDPGLRADRAKPHLLAPNARFEYLSPYLGTEIRGVQISQLSEEGFDELALYAAERKVLVLRDQDFKDIGPEKQIELVKRFGRIQLHPTSGNVKGYPEFHVVYRDADFDHLRRALPEDRINQTQWHPDVSYEKQPAGTTFFFILDQPPTGGDTLFASQVEAYNRLSPEFNSASRVSGRYTVPTNKPRTLFAAVADFDPAERRHAVRLTPQAEVPIPATA